MLDLNNINEDIIKKANELCEKGTHIYDCSGIIKNIISKNCKGYCVSNGDIPIVCGKNERCNNFIKSDKISKKIEKEKINNLLGKIY